MKNWQTLGLVAGIILFLVIVSWKFFFQSSSPEEILTRKGFELTYEPASIEFPSIIDKNKLGKLNMINFWATWCQPCVKELPDFNTLAGDFTSKELSVFAIARGESDERIQEFLTEEEIPSKNVTYLSDEKMEYFSALDLNLIPLTILVDSKGSIIAGVKGIREWNNPEIRSAISQLLARQ